MITWSNPKSLSPSISILLSPISVSTLSRSKSQSLSILTSPRTSAAPPPRSTRQHLAPPPPRLGSTLHFRHLTSHLRHLDFAASLPPRFENWAAPRLENWVAPRLSHRRLSNTKGSASTLRRLRSRSLESPYVSNYLSIYVCVFCVCVTCVWLCTITSVFVCSVLCTITSVFDCLCYL